MIASASKCGLRFHCQGPSKVIKATAGEQHTANKPELPVPLSASTTASGESDYVCLPGLKCGKT